VSENERTQQAARALLSGKAEQAGLLMNASHASMRDDFEISTPALDAIVEAARRRAGCLGARLTGAGFGGCAVALVRTGDLPGFISAVESGYRSATGLQAKVHLCSAAGGAEAHPVRADR
jgi:galactokinase